MTAGEAKISQLSCVGEMEIFQINVLILESVYWNQVIVVAVVAAVDSKSTETIIDMFGTKVSRKVEATNVL